MSDRIALTKLRLSDHTLAIEKGRHNSINASDRTCPFCPEQVEDETHFLVKCPIYDCLRKNLLDDVELLCIILHRIFIPARRKLFNVAPTQQSNHFRFYGKIYPFLHGAESFSGETTQKF